MEPQKIETVKKNVSQDSLHFQLALLIGNEKRSYVVSKSLHTQYSTVCKSLRCNSSFVYYSTVYKAFSYSIPYLIGFHNSSVE